MKSLWDDTEAAAHARGLDDPADQALALRVYTSRLVGREIDLVLHGGGNTSVKVVRQNGSGPDEVIHIKGSGRDLSTIGAEGLPAVRLAPLLKARQRAAMSDADMMTLLRGEMLDDKGPTPSVETLLHAFLPKNFVEHTHSAAALAIANQPDAASLAHDIFGSKLAIVPYTMPGFKLAIAGATQFENADAAYGLFLVNHGLFAQADDARSAYELILSFTTQCEDFLARHGAALTPPGAPRAPDTQRQAAVFAMLGAALRSHELFAQTLHLDLRLTGSIEQFLGLSDLPDIATRGTVTPDHVIRIKPRPVIGDWRFSEAEWKRAIAAEVDWYVSYFDRNAARAEEKKYMLDPLPRIALVQGLGLVGIGRSASEARICADLAEQATRIILSAEGIGRFTPIGESDLFDMEYWSLEQAKLGNPGQRAPKA